MITQFVIICGIEFSAPLREQVTGYFGTRNVELTPFSDDDHCIGFALKTELTTPDWEYLKQLFHNNVMVLASDNGVFDELSEGKFWVNNIQNYDLKD
jgi:hypothetical protein